MLLQSIRRNPEQYLLGRYNCTWKYCKTVYDTRVNRIRLEQFLLETLYKRRYPAFDNLKRVRDKIVPYFSCMVTLQLAQPQANNKSDGD